MTETVTALFDRYDDAATAVRDLEASGIPHLDISIVANNAEKWHQDEPSNAAADAGAGAGIGALLGGGVGVLTGLGIMAIPGVGPVAAAGWLVATAAGAVAGAVAGGAAGGIVGTMMESGVPERDAHVYAEGVRRGGTLVTARVPDERASAAKTVLNRSHTVDIGARRGAYEAGGWSKFDESAPAYTDEQVRKERSLYS
jgi:hypothetical protein